MRIPKEHPVKERLIGYIEGYKDSDEEIVDLYVETYEFYQQMREELKNGQMIVQYTNKAGATNSVKNPLIIEIAKTVQTMNNLLKSMGLTPAQRKDVSPKGGGDDFDKF
jgi:P27 family predicted phage terminase small subunit